jgi:capsular polysaccharide transport system permease protein
MDLSLPRARIAASRQPSRSLPVRPLIVMRRPMMDARVDVADYGDAAADEAPARGRRMPRAVGFALFAVLPAVLVWAYLSFIAAPVYVAEARFAVVPGAAVAPAGSAAEGEAIARQAGFVAADYMRSRQAVEDLRRSMNLAGMFAPDGLDLFNRFWWDDGSIDELARYWRNWAVEPAYDEQAGIASVTVRAFAPQDAQRIAQALVQNAERLVDDFGTPQREAMMTAAREEVDRTAAELADARKALLTFRAAQRTYAPTQTADATATLAANLRGSLSTMNAQLAVLTHTLAPTAPAVSVLKAQIGATETELERVRNSLGDSGKGADAASLPGQLDTYDMLDERRSLAVALHDRAATLLQDASLSAVAQRPAVALFVAPGLPQAPVAPRPMVDGGIVLVAAAALWWLGLGVRRALRPGSA